MTTLKTKLKTTWSSGDYGQIARAIEQSGQDFLNQIPFEPGVDFLDVACGTGQTAFPATSAGARVTGVDIALNLVMQARARAESEGVDIRFDEGDAEDLPYEDASFDLVFSLIGAMFAPNPALVASELMRVCRPGGRIVMGNWTPEGFIGKMFKTVARHAPPPPEMPSPLEWGNEEIVRQRFVGVADLRMRKTFHTFRYSFGPRRVVDLFREYFGPIIQAFAGLDAAGKEALDADLLELWETNNTSTNGTTYLKGELLEVIATR